MTRPPISHYLGDELEQIITIALRNFAADAIQPGWSRRKAEAFADALQNDTWLLQTSSGPEEVTA